MGEELRYVQMSRQSIHIGERSNNISYEAKSNEDSSLKKSAQKLFQDPKIKITGQSERHLGAIIGTELFREQYTKNKVEDWIKDIQMLLNYAQDDPQAAYSAFTKGLSSRSRWTHFQRTVPDTNDFYLNHRKMPSEISLILLW